MHQPPQPEFQPEHWGQSPESEPPQANTAPARRDSLPSSGGTEKSGFVPRPHRSGRAYGQHAVQATSEVPPEAVQSEPGPDGLTTQDGVTQESTESPPKQSLHADHIGEVVLAAEQADADEPDVPSGGTNPRQPEDAEQLGDAPKAGGGAGPGKPPTDKPPTSPGPDEPTDPEPAEGAPPPNLNAESMHPVDRYRRQLDNIAYGAQRAIEQPGDQASKLHSLGTVGSSGYQIGVYEWNTDADKSPQISTKLQSRAGIIGDLARNAVQDAQRYGLVPPASGQTEPAEYQVEENVVYGSSEYASRMAVRTLIDGEPGAEVITVTEVSIDESMERGEERLHARICSKDGVIIEAYAVAIAAEDAPYYDLLASEFGAETAIGQVLLGNFQDWDDAFGLLSQFAANANEMGVYSPELINQTVDHALRIGLKMHKDKAVDDGMTPARLARAQRHVDALCG